MKRCPECRRDFYDDTLSFCLDDGTQLVDGPASSESPTVTLEGADARTAILPGNVHTSAGSGVLPNKRKTIIAASIFAVLLTGALGFAIYKFQTPDTVDSEPFQSIKIEKLTSNGKATQAVVTPDGKQVVYVLDDAGERSLRLRQVATATDFQLTAPRSEVFYWALTISRDGNYLYYIYDGPTVRNRVLYQMPLVGGSAKKVVEDVGSPVGFSPDGKQVAFVRSHPPESAMMIANADGTGEREIARRKGPRGYGSHFSGGVSWSPDANKIVTVAANRDGEGKGFTIVEISIADGTERALTSRTWYDIQRLVGSPDGTGILITAAETGSEFRSRQIWYLPYAGGDARKITKDLSNYSSISLSADSNVLVTVQENDSSSVWIAPDSTGTGATNISSVAGKMDGYDGVVWTPDGKVVYTSMAGAGEAIWIMDADGRNRKQLTGAETALFPSVSTDGRYIAFAYERGRGRSLWRMDIDGSNQRQLSETGGNYPQATSAWIVHGGGLAAVWKTSVEGGERVPISENEGLARCAVSPDEKWIACQQDSPGIRTRLGVRPIDGSEPLKLFDVKFELPARIKWTRDGKSVTYISREAGLRDIWSQDVAGGAPKRLTKFNADQIFAFDWAADNSLVISLGESESDVVLIRNMK